MDKNHSTLDPSNFIAEKGKAIDDSERIKLHIQRQARKLILQVGNFFNLSGCLVCSLQQDNKNKFQTIFEWRSNSEENTLDFHQLYLGCPWNTETIKALIDGYVVRWQPSETRFSNDILHQYKFKYPVCFIPIFISGKTWGFVAAIGDLNRFFWKDKEIGFLSLISEIISHTIEKEHSEQKLYNQQEFFKKIIDLNPSFIFSKDAKGRFILVNKAVADLYGSTPAHIIGKTDADFNPKIDEVEHFNRDDLYVFKSNKQIFIPEEKVTNAAGEVRYLQTVKIPILSDTGEVEQVLGIATDITERKQFEEEQRKLEAQMQHAQKLESLGILAGGIAHDFNNLLVGVLGNAGLALKELELGQDVTKRINDIRISAKRAADLTNQLLAYTGKGQFLNEYIKINPLVNEMKSLFGSFISKKIKFEFNLSGEECFVKGDPSRLRQVIMNLITNAADAIGGSSGTIKIKTEKLYLSRPLEGQYIFNQCKIFPKFFICISVKDDGCGMGVENLQKIFDPFFSTKFTGRGLGLSAVQGIIKGHEGILEVHSEVGEGSEFKVYLPSEYVNKYNKDSIRINPVDKNGLNSKVIGKTILVVDDEDLTREVAEQILKHFGLNVRSASDGLEALRVYQDHIAEISGVLLDLTMPELDGEETLTEIKKINPDLPVIIASGYSETDIRERFKVISPEQFIQKPYEPQILLDKISRMFS